MSNCTRYLGLDVHAETITAAIAEGRGKIRSLGKFPNRPEAVRKLTEKLGGAKNLKVCYEAGPTGYALYWQLTKLGVDCEVIAPSLIPKKAGDRVKTDRRDAEKLAQSYQSGDLTPVWVPTPEHEALRDLVRQRAAAKADESRAKHRLVKHLLRRGLREPNECRAWTHPWWRWVQSLKFDHEAQQVAFADCIAEVLHMEERLARLDQAIDRLVASAPPQMQAVIEALQALRGVAKLTAVTIVTEVGTFQRFACVVPEFSWRFLGGFPGVSLERRWTCPACVVPCVVPEFSWRFLGGFPGVSLERRWTCPAIAVEGGGGWRERQPGRPCRVGNVVVGSGRMEIVDEEVWNLSSGTNAGRGFPLAAGRWACQRGGGQPRSGRGIEWQGRRKSPQGKHLRQLSCAVAQALGAGAEGVDKGAVLGAEFEFSLLVGCVDEWRGTAVGGGGTAVRILGQDGGDAHWLSTFGFVFGLGCGLDLFDGAAAFRLALVFGQVQQAGQGRELHVECGGELRGQDGLAALTSDVLGGAVEPGSAQQLAGGEGGDAVGTWPLGGLTYKTLFCPVGQNIA
jgi:transposase